MNGQRVDGVKEFVDGRAGREWIYDGAESRHPDEG